MLTVEETLDLLATHPTMRVSKNAPDWAPVGPLTLIGLPQYQSGLIYGNIQDNQWEFYAFTFGVN